MDRAIEQTEALIAKQQRIKTGLMQDLLTRGIDEHGNLRSEATHKFKDSPLGRIPVEWEVVTIQDLGKVVTGSTPDTTDSTCYDGNIMFITPKDVDGFSERITQTERTLTLKGLALCRIIPPNAICTVCIGSTIGKMGLTTSRCATNQQINTLIPAIDEDAELLLFSMRLFLTKQLHKEAGLQAVPIVNKSAFSRMFMPFPTNQKEKRHIREYLSAIGTAITSMSAELQKLRRLKTALMQDLLTGRRRVTALLNEKDRVNV